MKDKSRAGILAAAEKAADRTAGLIIERIEAYLEKRDKNGKYRRAGKEKGGRIIEYIAEPFMPETRDITNTLVAKNSSVAVIDYNEEGLREAGILDGDLNIVSALGIIKGILPAKAWKAGESRPHRKSGDLQEGSLSAQNRNNFIEIFVAIEKTTEKIIIKVDRFEKYES